MLGRVRARARARARTGTEAGARLRAMVTVRARATQIPLLALLPFSQPPVRVGMRVRSSLESIKVRFRVKEQVNLRNGPEIEVGSTTPRPLLRPLLPESLSSSARAHRLPSVRVKIKVRVKVTIRAGLGLTLGLGVG